MVQDFVHSQGGHVGCLQHIPMLNTERVAGEARLGVVWHTLLDVVQYSVHQLSWHVLQNGSLLHGPTHYISACERKGVFRGAAPGSTGSLAPKHACKLVRVLAHPYHVFFAKHTNR